MPAVDAFVGEGLAPSPYKIMRAQRDALAEALRTARNALDHETGANEYVELFESIDAALAAVEREP